MEKLLVAKYNEAKCLYKNINMTPAEKTK